MRPLTKEEIEFVKETHFTPTVYQCGQYYLTIFTDEQVEYGDNYKERREAYEEKWYKVASDYAKEKYGFDLDKFIAKQLVEDIDDSDSISLEYTATYLFYIFFTREELEEMKDCDATNFLKDYRYYFGYRKWDGGNLKYVQEAIEAKEGERLFYMDNIMDNVYNATKEEIENNPKYFKDKKFLDI